MNSYRNEGIKQFPNVKDCKQNCGRIKNRDYFCDILH